MARQSLGFIRIVLTLAAATSVFHGVLYAQGAGKPLDPKKPHGQATKAMEQMRWKEAQELYETVIASTTPGAPKYRADALYGAAIVRLSSAGPSAAGVVRPWLTELKAQYPRHVRAVEAIVALAMLDGIDGERSQLDNLRKQVATVTATVETSRAETAKLREQIGQLEAAAAAAAAASAQEATKKKGTQTSAEQSLRADVKKLRGELEAAKTEIVNKDAALKKVREALVNRKP